MLYCWNKGTKDFEISISSEITQCDSFRVLRYTTLLQLTVIAQESYQQKQFHSKKCRQLTCYNFSVHAQCYLHTMLTEIVFSEKFKQFQNLLVLLWSYDMAENRLLIALSWNRIANFGTGSGYPLPAKITGLLYRTFILFHSVSRNHVTSKDRRRCFQRPVSRKCCHAAMRY